MFAMGANSMKDMMEMVQNDIYTALSEHDTHAVGKLHQVCLHAFANFVRTTVGGRGK